MSSIEKMVALRCAFKCNEDSWKAEDRRALRPTLRGERLLTRGKYRTYRSWILLIRRKHNWGRAYSRNSRFWSFSVALTIAQNFAVLFSYQSSSPNEFAKWKGLNLNSFRTTFCQYRIMRQCSLFFNMSFEQYFHAYIQFVKSINLLPQSGHVLYLSFLFPFWIHFIALCSSPLYFILLSATKLPSSLLYLRLKLRTKNSLFLMLIEWNFFPPLRDF